MKTLYVTVKVTVNDDVDLADFSSSVDYDFDYPGVVDTEITDVVEK